MEILRKIFVENLSLNTYQKIFRGENTKNINLKIHIFRKIKSSLQQRFTPIDYYDISKIKLIIFSLFF